MRPIAEYAAEARRLAEEAAGDEFFEDDAARWVAKQASQRGEVSRANMELLVKKILTEMEKPVGQIPEEIARSEEAARWWKLFKNRTPQQRIADTLSCVRSSRNDARREDEAGESRIRSAVEEWKAQHQIPEYGQHEMRTVVEIEDTLRGPLDLGESKKMVWVWNAEGRAALKNAQLEAEAEESARASCVEAWDKENAEALAYLEEVSRGRLKSG